MSDSRDDDALAWAGDDDPTLTPVGVPAKSRARGAAPADPPARRSVLDEAEDAEDRAAEKELAEAEAASRQLSSAALIALGVIGGVYLLYTIGWIVSFTRFQTPVDVDFSVVSYRITQTLAIAATPIWFVATLLITQSKDARYRFLWLVIGILVLVPWPFLMGL
jgi:NAD/NADP transhydrogenase beta subunit